MQNRLESQTDRREYSPNETISAETLSSQVLDLMIVQHRSQRLSRGGSGSPASGSELSSTAINTNSSGHSNKFKDYLPQVYLNSHVDERCEFSPTAIGCPGFLKMQEELLQREMERRERLLEPPLEGRRKTPEEAAGSPKTVKPNEKPFDHKTPAELFLDTYSYERPGIRVPHPGIPDPTKYRSR
jgi:hypothetical protein